MFFEFLMFPIYFFAFIDIQTLGKLVYRWEANKFAKAEYKEILKNT